MQTIPKTKHANKQNMAFGVQERKIHKVLEWHASALIGGDSALAD